MQFEVGSILEGKVTGVKKFGAFVALPEGKTGMVHISEVSNEFIQDLSTVLEEGQTVKVKVINIAEDGKIALSIKRTLPAPTREQGPRPRGGFQSRGPQPARQQPSAPSQPQTKSFDDMLKQFMSESDSKMSSIRAYSDHKTKTRRR